MLPTKSIPESILTWMAPEIWELPVTPEPRLEPATLARTPEIIWEQPPERRVDFPTPQMLVLTTQTLPTRLIQESIPTLMAEETDMEPQQEESWVRQAAMQLQVQERLKILPVLTTATQ
jgi:hypothetical protein